MILDLLRRLCGNNRICPRSFAVHDVKKEGIEPVSEGSFGSVWKGVCREQRVAVKIMKYRASDESIKKVCSLYFLYILRRSHSYVKSLSKEAVARMLPRSTGSSRRRRMVFLGLS